MTTNMISLAAPHNLHPLVPAILLWLKIRKGKQKNYLTVGNAPLNCWKRSVKQPYELSILMLHIIGSNCDLMKSCSCWVI